MEVIKFQNTNTPMIKAHCSDSKSFFFPYSFFFLLAKIFERLYIQILCFAHVHKIFNLEN